MKRHFTLMQLVQWISFTGMLHVLYTLNCFSLHRWWRNSRVEHVTGGVWVAFPCNLYKVWKWRDFGKEQTLKMRLSEGISMEVCTENYIFIVIYLNYSKLYGLLSDFSHIYMYTVYNSVIYVLMYVCVYIHTCHLVCQCMFGVQFIRLDLV